MEEYQTTRHVEEALHRLTETYLALGIVPEAQTAAAVLGHNFPDSEWYQDSYKLLNKGGLAAFGEQGLLDFPGLRPGVVSGSHAGQSHRSGRRSHRPARHGVRRRVDGADRRDGSGQVHPARRAGARSGARGDAALVRAGAERGQITAVFEPAPGHPAFMLLEENDIAPRARSSCAACSPPTARRAPSSTTSPAASRS